MVLPLDKALFVEDDSRSAEELDPRAKIADLDAYLAALEAELARFRGMSSARVRQWAGAVLPADRTTAADR